jgi:hypothetical protein
MHTSTTATLRRLLPVPVAVLAATIGLSAATAPSASDRAATAAAGLPGAYQGALRNATLTLGAQAHPTLVVSTPRLPAGNYLVTYSVSAVMGPTRGGAENVVCGATPTAAPHNDGLFGVAGNGSQTSGDGPSGVYGSAAQTDIIRIATRTRVRVWCNSGTGTAGTYVSGASITALRVGTVVTTG